MTTLDDFGSCLIREARDEAISAVDRLLAGDDRSDRGRRVGALLGDLTPSEVRSLRAVAVDAIDELLHQVLWMFERSEKYDVVARLETGEPVSLRDASDGLSGELYGPDGWIARFSRFGDPGEAAP